MDLVRRLVEGFLRYDLRRTFRRVCWVGEWPPALPDGPVIAYSNHHYFYDGHLAWLALTDRLGRPTTVWMTEWDRVPFFAAVGAQPFPPNDPARRGATLRRTARRFENRPRTTLVYYPEGTLHPPEEGIQQFDPEPLQRLDRLYSSATWWPFAVRVTWWNEPRPTALLAGGRPHSADGQERTRLQELRRTLQTPGDRPQEVLLDSSDSIKTTWDLSFAAPYFEQYL